MNRPPMAHRIKRPFEYVSSESTDVAKTIKRARDAMKPKTKQPANVQPLKRKIAA